MLSLEHNTSRYQKLLCPIKFIKTVLSTISVGTRSFCAQNQIQKVSLNKSDLKSFINTALKGKILRKVNFFCKLIERADDERRPCCRGKGEEKENELYIYLFYRPKNVGFNVEQTHILSKKKNHELIERFGNFIVFYNT
uniref:Uncharacterized protein n=1 Tax=Cacopsylla melanoneura TaxID=428564 RepID=A0A8D8M6Q3_9HEMI